ncbi:MAG TPA: hypothetical protein VFV68_01035 [Agriterribacter sp.]|nr:hypothetical protein [Agriterribacter sp.]
MGEEEQAMNDKPFAIITRGRCGIYIERKPLRQLFLYTRQRNLWRFQVVPVFLFKIAADSFRNSAVTVRGFAPVA